MDQFPPNHKSGFVAVIGSPNVGKSTFINQLLGTKIAATSPWPQTTRKSQMGILTFEQAQIVFVDTPGFHNTMHKLGERMNQEALHVLEESDLILFLVDISQPPNEDDRLLAGSLSSIRRSVPILLALNKFDLESEEINQKHKALYQSLVPISTTIMISATRGDNLDQLVDKILQGDGPGSVEILSVLADYGADLGGGWTAAVAFAHLAFWDRRAIWLLNEWNVGEPLPDSKIDDMLNPVLEPFWQRMRPEVTGQMAVEAAREVNGIIESVSDDKVEALRLKRRERRQEITLDHRPGPVLTRFVRVAQQKVW